MVGMHSSAIRDLFDHAILLNGIGRLYVEQEQVQSQAGQGQFDRTHRRDRGLPEWGSGKVQIGIQ